MLVQPVTVTRHFVCTHILDMKKDEKKVKHDIVKLNKTKNYANI